MTKSRQHIRSSLFDSITVDGTYVAFTDNADCIEFEVHNASAIEVDIRKGGAGSVFILDVGGSVILKGNPSAYACKRNSGSGAINVTAVVYTI